MNRSLWDDVGIEAVAKVNRIDIVTGVVVRMLASVGVLRNNFFPLRFVQFLQLDYGTLLWAQNASSEEGTLRGKDCATDHSKSLYMIVKKTCRNRLTALSSTERRYSHDSPVMVITWSCRSSFSTTYRSGMYR